jgi:hypothetical protein
VGLPPSITATQELVVPKSIPTTFAIWGSGSVVITTNEWDYTGLKIAATGLSKQPVQHKYLLFGIVLISILKPRPASMKGGFPNLKGRLGFQRLNFFLLSLCLMYENLALWALV